MSHQRIPRLVLPLHYRLRHVPGPLLNSLTVLPLFKLASSGKISFVLNDIQKAYGPLVRIAPNVVLFGDAPTLGRTLKVHQGAVVQARKAAWYIRQPLFDD